MTQKRTAKINRVGASFGTSMNRSTDWFFADTIEGFTESKRRNNNKKIVEWERARRMGKTAKNVNP